MQPPISLADADAVTFAVDRHGDQLYAGQPYSHHLKAVEQVLTDFGFTGSVWQARAWLHDVLEDTDTTVAELCKLFGAQVADVVWCVTGEGGGDRTTHNQTQRDKIVRYRDFSPAILKCADRINNVESCIADPATGKPNAKYGEMYLEERRDFCAYIQRRVPERMFARLEIAFNRLTEALAQER